MAKSSEWNLIRGVRSNPGRGIEFELGKNNWETRRGEFLSIHLSSLPGGNISSRRRKGIFIRTPVSYQIWLHFAAIPLFTESPKFTWQTRSGGSPFDFRILALEREREIADSRQIANPTSPSPSCYLDVAQIFARQFYATLLYYLNDLLPSPLPRPTSLYSAPAIFVRRTVLQYRIPSKQVLKTR